MRCHVLSLLCRGWGGGGLQSALTLCSPAIPLLCFGNVVWLPAEGSGGVNSPKSQLERRGGETWFALVPRSLDSAFLHFAWSLSILKQLGL